MPMFVSALRSDLITCSAAFFGSTLRQARLSVLIPAYHDRYDQSLDLSEEELEDLRATFFQVDSCLTTAAKYMLPYLEPELDQRKPLDFSEQSFWQRMSYAQDFKGQDVLEVIKRCLYVVLPDGYGYDLSIRALNDLCAQFMGMSPMPKVFAEMCKHHRDWEGPNYKESTVHSSCYRTFKSVSKFFAQWLPSKDDVPLYRGGISDSLGIIELGSVVPPVALIKTVLDVLAYYYKDKVLDIDVV